MSLKRLCTTKVWGPLKLLVGDGENFYLASTRTCRYVRLTSSTHREIFFCSQSAIWEPVLQLRLLHPKLSFFCFISLSLSVMALCWISYTCEKRAQHLYLRYQTWHVTHSLWDESGESLENSYFHFHCPFSLKAFYVFIETDLSSIFILWGWHKSRLMGLDGKGRSSEGVT